MARGEVALDDTGTAMIVFLMFVGLLQAASDLLLAVLEPRWRDGAERLGGVS